MIDGRGRVLMGLRASWKSVWPDHWDSIGGHVEPGESIVAALVRELHEEVGVTAAEFLLLDVVMNARPGVDGALSCHVFAVTEWLGEPWNACDEHSELRWFDPEELASLPNLAGVGYPELARCAVAIKRQGKLADGHK